MEIQGLRRLRDNGVDLSILYIYIYNSDIPSSHLFTRPFGG